MIPPAQLCGRTMPNDTRSAEAGNPGRLETGQLLHAWILSGAAVRARPWLRNFFRLSFLSRSPALIGAPTIHQPGTCDDARAHVLTYMEESCRGDVPSHLGAPKFSCKA